MTVFPKMVKGLVAALVLMAGVGLGEAFAADVTKVMLTTAPAGVVIEFTEAIPAKVVKIDDHELFIALKGVTIPKRVLMAAKNRSLRLLAGRQTPGVSTLMLRTEEPILSMAHRWRGSRLVISLDLKKSVRHISSNTSKQVAEVLTPDRILGTALPKKEVDRTGADLIVREGFTGTADDLLLEMKSTLCPDAVGIDRILSLLKNGAWRRAEKEALAALNRTDLSKGCAEGLEALGLLGAFREGLIRNDQRALVELPYRFNDFISRFPDSVYMPYALSMLGQVYEALGDHGMAEGYFRVVLEDYPSFPAAAETLFNLGRLLRETSRASQAVPLLAHVEKLGQALSFARAARKEYALALYDVGDFLRTQVLFETLMDDGEEEVWKDPDLLLYAGRSALRAGHRATARRHFVTFVNLFPDAEGADMALESVGESWVDEGQVNRGISFFKLVIDRYPDGEGEVAASVRLAEQLQDRVEKEALYQRVIEGFPEHPLARLSMLRMAALFDEAGNFTASVDMIKTLLDVGAGGLRTEAYARMEQAVLGLFRAWMDQKEYVELIAFHEKERRLLMKLENPDISLLSGEAFMAAHLYGSAAEELERAIVLSLKRARWSGKDRLAGLYFKLGLALDEGGRKDEAKNIFTRYLERYPKSPSRGEASLRLGRLLFDSGEVAKAESLFQRSLSLGGGADARLWISKCRENDGDLAGSATRLEEAIGLYEKEDPTPETTLYTAQRRLGDVSMKLGRYRDAVTAYSRAENFSVEGSSPQELRFLRADALTQGGEKQSALTLYRSVAASDDEFWAGMASERLRSMELTNRLNSKPPAAR